MGAHPPPQRNFSPSQIERFSTECRKTKTKVKTTANQKKEKYI